MHDLQDIVAVRHCPHRQRPIWRRMKGIWNKPYLAEQRNTWWALVVQWAILAVLIGILTLMIVED